MLEENADNFEDEAPPDVAAVAFEDTHWLPKDNVSGYRFPGSIGEGGGIKSSLVKDDHFRAKINDPTNMNVWDGDWGFGIENELIMHPSADGVSQLYGNYSHTWKSIAGSIKSISIGPGTFSVSLTWGASDWEIELDPLLVTKNQCDPSCWE